MLSLSNHGVGFFSNLLDFGLRAKPALRFPVTRDASGRR